MTDTEDDPLIERLARAACEADGLDPETRNFPPATYRGEVHDGTIPNWMRYWREARRHLAMQRELALTEVARLGQEFDRHDKDTDQ